MIQILIAWVYYLFAMIFIILFYPIVRMQIRNAAKAIAEAPMKVDENRGRVQGRSPVLNIVFVGDSTIEGRGLGQVSDALPAKIAEALQLYSKREINWQGIGERTLSSKSIVEFVDSLEPLKTGDLLFFLIGMNDVFRLTPVWRFKRNIGALIPSISSKSKKQIVFSGLLPMERYSGLSFPLALAAGLYGRCFDAVLSSFRGGNIFYLPAPVPKSRHFTVDGLHPDRIGNLRWGDYVGRQLTIAMDLRKKK